MNLAPAVERAAGDGKAWTTGELARARCQKSERKDEKHGLTEALATKYSFRQRNAATSSERQEGKERGAAPLGSWWARIGDLVKFSSFSGFFAL